ncbi:hypothetical protein [Zavarzinella formosa]|uniref:hypothetical protein n=1 Tax=Zavarzinella formosa TaxID=360055 RepID=UPI00030D2DBC|nr:hypothetical protein [Zavarzinella formosa]
MTVYISIGKKNVVYVITIITPPPDADRPLPSGRAMATIRPGQSFRGYTHDELVAIGNGKHDLTPKSAPSHPSA